MNIPTPPHGHPRLFFRQCDLEGLRRKAQAPAMRPVCYHLRALQHIAAPAAFDAIRNRRLGLYGDPMFESIKACALFRLLDGDDAAGREAVRRLNEVLSSIDFSCNPLYDEMYTRTGGELLLVIAVVYDWCCDLLTQQEKQDLRAAAKDIVAHMEAGWPPVRQGAVSSHSGEAQLLRDIFSAAIAFYEEDPSWYEMVAPQLFEEFIPLRNYVYRSHAYHQGNFYSTFRYQWEIYFAWICRRMGFGDVFSPDQGQVPYSWLYARLPDGQVLKDGDSVQSTLPDTPYWHRCYTRSFMLAASYYGDPYLQGEYLRCDPYGEYAPIDGAAQTVEQFLFFDPDLAPAAPRDLPLSRLFGEPCGGLVARTGFDLFDPRTVVASFKIGQIMFKNHQHRDSGQFQIFYRDMLALDSGVYESSVPGAAYRSEHRMNYMRHTIAHNCMVFPDSRVPHDHGGQLCDEGDPHYNGLADMLADPEARFARQLCAHIGNEVSWASADLAPAYGPRVKSYVRSFVFVATGEREAPAVVLVYDHALPAEKMEPVWLLHTQTCPELGPDGFLVNNGGCLTGRFYANGTTRLEKVGGPGHEYDTFGTEHPAPDFPLARPQAGRWRVQLRGEPGQPFECLTVMTVSDPGATLPDGKARLTPDGAEAEVCGRRFLFDRGGLIRMEEIQC